MEDNILTKLATHAKERVAIAKQNIALDEMIALASKAHDEMLQKSEESNKATSNSTDQVGNVANSGFEDFAFENALKGADIHFICEVKKASPSKGLIAEDFPFLEIAKSYEEAGASCISVLTEPKWFQGSNDYLKAITDTVHIPVIRKDFTVDEYMIYEAKVLGASAVLLICSILSDEQLQQYIKVADSLGLSSLVEAHDEEEVKRAADAGARIIGVNNRNLKDFTVDIHNSIRLRNLVSRDIIFVAESGIKTHEDIEELRTNGVNGVLIGETLMRAANKKEMLNTLKNG